MSSLIEEYQRKDYLEVTKLSVQLAKAGDLESFSQIVGRKFNLPVVLFHVKKGWAEKFIQAYEVAHNSEDLDELFLLAVQIDQGDDEARQKLVQKVDDEEINEKFIKESFHHFDDERQEYFKNTELAINFAKSGDLEGFKEVAGKKFNRSSMLYYVKPGMAQKFMEILREIAGEDADCLFYAAKQIDEGDIEIFDELKNALKKFNKEAYEKFIKSSPKNRSSIKRIEKCFIKFGFVPNIYSSFLEDENLKPWHRFLNFNVTWLSNWIIDEETNTVIGKCPEDDILDSKLSLDYKSKLIPLSENEQKLSHAFKFKYSFLNKKEEKDKFLEIYDICKQNDLILNYSLNENHAIGSLNQKDIQYIFEIDECIACLGRYPEKVDENFKFPENYRKNIIPLTSDEKTDCQMKKFGYAVFF